MGKCAAAFHSVPVHSRPTEVVGVMGVLRHLFGCLRIHYYILYIIYYINITDLHSKPREEELAHNYSWLIL